MKIVIIEDEAPAFRRLQKILEEVMPDVELVEVFDSVEGAVEWIKANDQPDLFFMDIQLSDGLSFEIFDQVNVSSPVIFTTAFDEYMLKAFKVNSVDYLLKPIKKEDLQFSIEKLSKLRSLYSSGDININEIVKQINLESRDYKSRYLIRQGDKMLSVETDQIAFFQTRNGVVHLTTFADRTFLMDQSLDELESSLNPQQFYRANRQFIVCFSAIQAIHKYHKGKLLVEVKPKSRDEIIISAEKASKFKLWMDS